MALDILAVGAHPDDVEIAIGGTLIKMVRRGHSVKICDLTDGEPTPLGDRDTRLKEAARSASIIGVERITLDMPNRYLEDTPESRRQLALVIRQLQPNLLLAPYNGGEHPDHITASAIVDGARFYAKLTKSDMHGHPWPGEPWWTPNLFYYLGLGVYEHYLRPSFIVDISEEYPRKMEALSSYKTQKTVVERLSQSSEHYGPVIQARHAEAFFSRAPLTVEDLFDLR